MKLYEAYSTVDIFGYRDVRFHWFVSERREPVVTPEEAITDYAKLREDIQVHAFSYVNELLTESEVFALRYYLRKKHGADTMSVTEVELPILGVWEENGREVSIMGMLASSAAGEIPNLYELPREKGYNLDVPIWGYFDLDRHERIIPTTGAIVVGHDDKGEMSIVITLRPGDGFSWEYPLSLIPHVSQMLEGIALSQLSQADVDDLPF